MRRTVLVGKRKRYLTNIASFVQQPVCFLFPEICYAVKSESYSMREGGLACSVMPRNAGYIAE